MPTSNLSMLAALLGVACATDIRSRRIPNLLVATAMLTGIGVGVMHDGVAGMLRALAASITGLVIWLPLWSMRMVGGGDVKLFAAGSAWLSPAGAINAALFTGLFGGVLTLLYACRHYGVHSTLFRLSQGARHPQLLRELPSSAPEHRVPYALAMAVGLMSVAGWSAHLI